MIQPLRSDLHFRYRTASVMATPFRTMRDILFERYIWFIALERKAQKRTVMTNQLYQRVERAARVGAGRGRGETVSLEF